MDIITSASRLGYEAVVVLVGLFLSGFLVYFLTRIGSFAYLKTKMNLEARRESRRGI